jgi:uncharacterized damage-inducible protein DinB
MSELGDVWRFTRTRLDDAIRGLTPRQLAWKAHERAHSIAEIVYHVAACEHYWAARLAKIEPIEDDFDRRLEQAVHAGFLRDGDSPFGEVDATPEALSRVLERTAAEIGPLYDLPTPDQLSMPLTSPIGDPVTGKDGLTRLAQHAGYHTGQIWMLRSDPRFPSEG